MVARIKGILLSPKEEWVKIDAEPMTTQGIMTGWVVPLAAITPVAMFLGAMLILSSIPIGFRFNTSYLLATAVLSYVMAVIGAYVTALVVDALAPTFGGTKNPVAALKVVAFGSTAAYLAGIFLIVPMLGILAIVGLYSLYLIYVGLPILMKVPQDKVIAYTIVAILSAAVILGLANYLAGQLVAMFVAPYSVTPYAIP
jgi:hypothetical protein